MRNLLIFTSVLFFNSFFTFAQNQLDCAALEAGTFSLCETFADGDFSANPTWTGDTDNWNIEDGQLRSNGPEEAAQLQLVVPSTVALDAQWEFYINLRFNTSGSNFADVFLVADASDLKNALNGYFVRLGTTDDEVSLYRKDADGTETEIIDGDNGITAPTNNPLNIKITRTALGEWALALDQSGIGAFEPQGTATDNTYTSSTHFGLVANHTSSNRSNFYFDDFYIGDIIIDDTPPMIISATALSSSTVALQFSETLEAASAQNVINYQLNGMDNFPTNAVQDLDNPSTVLLTFPTSFGQDVENVLQVDFVQDLADNVIPTTLVQFTYHAFLPDDIIINELYADESPSLGLPDFEFVELYNRTDFAVNLNDWVLSDPSDDATFPNVVLEAGGYLIVCAAGTAASAYAGFGNVVGLSGFPGLNNASDVLTLTTNTGLVMNTVAYSSTWYRDGTKDDGGYTLERINPDNICGTDQNWIASINEIGGSPGTANSVLGMFADTQAPQISSVNITTNNLLEVTFTEALDLAAADDPTSYTIDNGIGNPSMIAAESELTMTLFLASDLQQSVLYTLTVSDIIDCEGNVLNGGTIQFALPEPAEPYDILMNEIYADLTVPEGFETPEMDLPEAQFVELYNRSDKAINIEGWQFIDATDTVFLNAYLLLPNTYVVLGSSTNASLFVDKNIPFSGVSSFPKPNVGGDNLKLIDTGNDLIHSVSFNQSWYQNATKSQGGWTLELIDPSNPCEGKSNWRASEDARGGTPGEQNSVNTANPDQIPPDLLRAEAFNNNKVLLFFSETLDRSIPLDPSFYTLDNGLGQPVSVSVPRPNFNTVLLTLANNMQEDVVYNVTVSGVTDCVGNVVGMFNEAKFGLPKTAELGDLVINEILFDPPTGGVDFVELYNRSNKIINLSGWFMTNGDIETTPGEDLIIRPITTDLFSIFPDSYVVLTLSPEFVKEQYGGSCGTINLGNFITMDLPHYADDEGIVAITDLFASVEMDRVDYSADWHFELLDAPEGASLERIDPNGDSQNPSNWHSASAVVCHATPGYANSQFYNHLTTGDNITIEPKTFSPDDDGFKDFTTISYQFDEPENTANITIYDERGREVKNLVRNELLGSEGVYKWDGVTDTGEKAPIGIYIIYAEIFNLNGNVQSFKETVTLGGRLD